MGKHVGIMTSTVDVSHCAEVTTHLLAAGAEVSRVDFDLLSDGGAPTTFRPQPGELNLHLAGAALSGIDTCWFRKPRYWHLDDKYPKDVSDLVSFELGQTLDGVLAYLEDRVGWLNRPSAIDRGNLKIVQAHLARELDMPLPPMIITNEPEEVEAFAEACGGFDHVVVKFHGNHMFTDAQGVQRITPTSILTPQVVESMRRESSRIPFIFQQAIDKTHELRVYVVGEDIIVARGDMPNGEKPVIDMRDPDANVKYSSGMLSDENSSRLLEMMARLQLRYGAADFVVDADGREHFLEVNPNGQWMWIERQDPNNLPISRAIAAELLRS